VLAVTVLTSDPQAGAELVGTRVRLAAATGCLGVVCAAADLSVVRAQAPGLFTAVPGIRLKGSPHEDQARAAGPFAAVRSGADLLVVGRTVTSSGAPELAAERLSAEVAAALAPGQGSAGE
jgi:orotidine-5'-phosphate decarboxylase